MARSRTEDLPDLSVLLLPPDAVMVAVEQAVLRHRESGLVTASLPEQIAAKLAGVITLDLVHAGQRLLEQDISKVLGISRAPVRESLRILERDGLVEFQSRRGAMVKAPGPDDLRDVFTVRAALYGILLREEMRERPAALKAVLDAHMPRVVESAQESVDAYAVATFELNNAIADHARNRTLADLLRSVSLQTLRYVRLGLAANPSSIGGFLRSWRALHRAIARGDTDLVVELAERRIGKIRDAAIRALGNSPVKAAG